MSVEECASIAPALVLVLILLLGGSLADLRRRLDVIHVRHHGLELLGLAKVVLWLLIASTTHVLVLAILLELRVHHALCLGFAVKHDKLFAVLAVRHVQLLTDLDEALEAVDVLRMLVVNIFIDLECIVEQAHAAVA